MGFASCGLVGQLACALFAGVIVHIRLHLDLALLVIRSRRHASVEPTRTDAARDYGRMTVKILARTIALDSARVALDSARVSRWRCCPRRSPRA